MNTGFQTRKFKGGAYTTVLSALVIFLLLLINLVVSGVAHTKDLTNTGTYSLKEDTLSFLKDYDTPIELYYISEMGKESVVISSTAENFALYGKQINLTYKDPVQYPQFVYQYNDMGEIHNNSIIVVNGNDPDRYVYIDADRMFVKSVDVSTFKETTIGYCAEAELMKALVKVSETEKSTVYVAMGHEEQLVSTEQMLTIDLSNLLALNSYSVRFIDLKKSTVPEDCDALLLIGPVADFSEEEGEQIKDYMTNGGKVVWFLAYTGVRRPVQESLLSYYGLKMEDGFLCEGDTNRTSSGKPNYVLSAYGRKNVLWPLGAGVSVLPNLRDSLTVSREVTTSDKAYIRKDVSSLLYEEGNLRGTFSLLTKVSETYHNKTGIMYVFNTYLFVHKNCIGTSAYANAEVFTKCLGELCEKSNVITVPNTDAFEEGLKMTTHQKNMILIVLVGVIPGIILLLGIAMVIKRRR